MQLIISKCRFMLIADVPVDTGEYLVPVLERFISITLDSPGVIVPCVSQMMLYGFHVGLEHTRDIGCRIRNTVGRCPPLVRSRCIHASGFFPFCAYKKEELVFDNRSAQ